MKQIAQNFKGHYKEIILGPFFKLVEAVLELFVPLVMADIIDVGVRTGDVGYIVGRAGLMLLLATLGAAAALTCQYFAAVAAGHFGKGLRKQVYHHVMQFSPAETARFGAGGLITRLTNDVNQMQTGVNMAIRLGSRVPFLAVGSIVMALALNWRIGLVFFATTPLIGLVLFFIMRRTVPRYAEIQARQDTLARLGGENLAGARVIRAFSRQKQENKDFDSAAADLSVLTVRVGKISAALNPITGFVVNMAIVLIVWLGANFAFAGNVLPGEIIALVSYMNQTLLALVVAANLIVLFTRAMASTRRVAAVLEVEPSIVDGPGAKEMAGAAAVTFENVSFAYHEGSEAALQGIDFAIEPGQTVGVIGGTGSGKTTLVNLLVRYYDAINGVVNVDGIDVRQYEVNALRKKIGLVPQAAALLSGSVRHNLAIAAPNATDEEMWQALRTAQAADFVQKLPEGLDSMIEEGGKNLSGGQKQRLTIARALVRKPEILVLDDSASALDYATDAALRQALREMQASQTLTTIMISQRASTIKNADSILVLDEGHLVGQGNHEELLTSNSVYQEICASQGLWPKGGVAQ